MIAKTRTSEIPMKWTVLGDWKRRQRSEIDVTTTPEIDTTSKICHVGFKLVKIIQNRAWTLEDLKRQKTSILFCDKNLRTIKRLLHPHAVGIRNWEWCNFNNSHYFVGFLQTFSIIQILLKNISENFNYFSRKLLVRFSSNRVLKLIVIWRVL